MKNLYLFPLLIIGVLISCNSKTNVQNLEIKTEIFSKESKSAAQQIKELKEAGFQIFDYVDEETGDTIIMQEYFMAFLKRGPNQGQTKQIRVKVRNRGFY